MKLPILKDDTTLSKCTKSKETNSCISQVEDSHMQWLQDQKQKYKNFLQTSDSFQKSIANYTTTLETRKSLDLKYHTKQPHKNNLSPTYTMKRIQYIVDDWDITQLYIDRVFCPCWDYIFEVHSEKIVDWVLHRYNWSLNSRSDNFKLLAETKEEAVKKFIEYKQNQIKDIQKEIEAIKLLNL